MQPMTSITEPQTKRFGGLRGLWPACDAWPWSWLLPGTIRALRERRSVCGSVPLGDLIVKPIVSPIGIVLAFAVVICSPAPALPFAVAHPAQQAANASQKCAHATPKTPAEHLTAGECFARNQQWKAAEEHFRLARQSPDTLAAATVGHARALFHLNQPYDAMLELEEFLRKHPDSAPALTVLATLHSVVADDTTRALAIMEQCSKVAPGDSAVWQHLGNLYLVKGRDEEALRCFEKAVELTPQDAQALAGLGYFYSKFGRLDEAKTRFDQALALLPQAVEPAVVWLTYGKALQEQRDWKKSRWAYTEALKLDPRSSEAHYGRGVANENLKELDNAKADALAALSEFPVPRKDAYLLLVRIARAQKDQAGVDKYASELARIDAEEARQKEESRVLRDLLFKAEPLFTQGQFVQAAAAYEQLVSRAPQFYEAYFALGMCYAQTAQLPKAEEAFKRYLALQPLSADGHASLGLVLLQTNRIGEARLELERALEIDPAMLEARKTVARIHASTANFATALDLLLQAPNPEGEWEEDYYILLVSCAVAAKRTAEALRFCQIGSARFPSSERLPKACSQLK